MPTPDTNTSGCGSTERLLLKASSQRGSVLHTNKRPGLPPVSIHSYTQTNQPGYINTIAGSVGFAGTVYELLLADADEFGDGGDKCCITCHAVGMMLALTGLLLLRCCWSGVGRRLCCCAHYCSIVCCHCA